jgi:hypothetical protein
MEMVESATEGISIAHKAFCEAEANRHRARELLALSEAAVTDLAVRVRGAHERSQDAFSRREAAAADEVDAGHIASHALTEEQVSRQTLEDCQSKFDTAKNNLQEATNDMNTSGKELEEAGRGHFNNGQEATRAAETMRRCQEAKEFLGPLAKMAEGVATQAMNDAQARMAKFPPDPEGLVHAGISRAKKEASDIQQKMSEEMEKQKHKDSKKAEDARTDAKKQTRNCPNCPR